VQGDMVVVRSGSFEVVFRLGGGGFHGNSVEAKRRAYWLRRGFRVKWWWRDMVACGWGRLVSGELR